MAKWSRALRKLVPLRILDPRGIPPESFFAVVSYISFSMVRIAGVLQYLPFVGAVDCNEAQVGAFVLAALAAFLAFVVAVVVAFLVAV